jgi:calcineurin-like phosphoesterase family protein
MRNQNDINRDEKVLEIPKSIEYFKFDGEFDVGKLWVISDTHFFHKNIRRYCGRPRDWHQKTISNWNKKVAPTDYILHLGDVMLGKSIYWPLLNEKLSGIKFLILGNHDKSASYFRNLGWTVLGEQLWINYHGKKLFFSHEPFVITDSSIVNIHGHIHNNGSIFDKSQNHINVSLELIGYSPQRLESLL